MSVTELPVPFRNDAAGPDRLPPQDLAAEQSVLGAMMLSKDAIADVVETVREGDFYRPAHQSVYATVLDLYARGEPADAVTVAAELTRAGELGRVGGAPYLHTLVAAVPTAANAGYYARIVRERAILRRLVEAGTRIVQMGYTGEGDVDSVVDRAQAEVYDVTERRTSEDYAPLRDLMDGALSEIEAISNRGGEMIGVPTGFADLDALMNGLHPGQLVIIAARPGLGKSTLGLDLARSASIKHGLASVIFSLEMSRNEIVMRLLSAEAQVPLHHMRSGSMGDAEWRKIAAKMGTVSDAPLFIDDSPNMTMMEIRAKCRRLKQRHDLRLVVVDYLQLMTSGKRVESRQQEVAEFSRAMKLLAKELELPVIAISQLNRGAEQRTDKKPMLADLRESGCLTADTRIVRADTNVETTLGELLEAGAKDVPVWSLDDRLRYVPRTMTHVFPSGVKDVYRLWLASGRTIEATANHPFLTYQGWAPLGELLPGSRIAAPRHLPPPLEIAEVDENELILLAHMIGDGSMLPRQPLRYASQDKVCLRAVEQAAYERFGISAVRDEYPQARVTTVRLRSPFHLTHGRRNPMVAWLDGLGLFGRRSHDKFVPSMVFSSPKEQVALFLTHLWATDGSIRLNRNGGGAIYYATTSRRLADDVCRLLLRFGITGRLSVVPKAGYRDSYHVHVSGAADQKVFLRRIGGFGAKAAPATEVLVAISSKTENTNVDTIPTEVWDKVRGLLVERKMTHREFAAAMGTQFCGSTLWRHAPSRQRLARVAAVLDDSELELEAINDVTWDRVVSIDHLGEQPVFDATVLGTHNFVANGIAVHNSLEQDADVVVLIHREDAYERESPRAGEADFIVAKHRNGPTATVTVAFQGHYSRFVDMAQM